jgi:hypothetical protein
VTAAALEANGENLTAGLTLQNAATVAVGSHVTWVKGDATDTLTLSGATVKTSVGVYVDTADGNAEYDVYSYKNGADTRYAAVSKNMTLSV